jgi:hypothetical protein
MARAFWDAWDDRLNEYEEAPPASTSLDDDD